MTKKKAETKILNWPKTPERKAKEFEEQMRAASAVAQVGQIMTAASAVPMPKTQKLISDAAKAASKGTVGKNKKGKGKKRAWQEHADEYFATNNAWDEVNGIFQACLDLLRTSLALLPLLNNKELLKCVANVQLLTRNVTAINRDTRVLAEELTKIRKTHQDKNGGSKNQEEMLESCMVFSRYVDFMERYDSALMPIVVHASEQLQEALNELQKQQPELAHELTGRLQSNLHQTQELSDRLQGNLSSIQTVVHGITGADDTQTPDSVARASAQDAQPQPESV